jgi:hypothetical protein
MVVMGISRLWRLEAAPFWEIVHPGLNILQDADKGRFLITMVFNDFTHCTQIYLHLIFLD